MSEPLLRVDPHVRIEEFRLDVLEDIADTGHLNGMVREAVAAGIAGDQAAQEVHGPVVQPLGGDDHDHRRQHRQRNRAHGFPQHPGQNQQRNRDRQIDPARPSTLTERRPRQQG